LWYAGVALAPLPNSIAGQFDNLTVRAELAPALAEMLLDGCSSAGTAIDSLVLETARAVTQLLPNSSNQAYGSRLGLQEAAVHEVGPASQFDEISMAWRVVVLSSEDSVARVGVLLWVGFTCILLAFSAWLWSVQEQYRLIPGLVTAAASVGPNTCDELLAAASELELAAKS